MITFTSQFNTMKSLLIILLSLSVLAKSSAQDFQGHVLIGEVNILRTDPKQYASYVKEYLERYRGRYDGLDDAAQEVIALLESMEPLSPLTNDSLIQQALLTHPGVTSTGVSHSTLYIPGFTSIAENISSGNHVRNMVIQMLIDLGSESKGHRKNLLGDYTHTAIRRVETSKGTFWIQEFAR